MDPCQKSESTKDPLDPGDGDTVSTLPGNIPNLASQENVDMVLDNTNLGF